MENIVKNFHEYLIEKKCKNIALFKIEIDGQVCTSIVVSMPSVIENKKLAENIMKDFGLQDFPEGYNKGEWIIFDFDNIILNCFIPSVREKFNLEKLWQKEKVEGIIKEVVNKKNKDKAKTKNK